LRVAFAGTPAFALPALAALCARHEVIGVLTQPDRPKGRGRKLAFSPVKAAALERALPLDQPPTLRSAAGRAALEAWAPEALIVVAYGLLLPPEVLRLPRYGCLNIHASLLPRWRGAAPIQRAILAGDAESGVTIMQMNQGLDTGPVLLQRATPIAPGDTAGALQDVLARLGAEALIEALSGLQQGNLSSRAQPQEGVTYAGKVEKAEARIDWSAPAALIERQVRAFNPVPVAETTLGGQQLRIYTARAESIKEPNVPLDGAENARTGSIIAVNDDYMRVRCGAGTLAVTEVQLPGRRPMSLRDFSHAHALLGQRLG
jgi:methionyl-tRNA formyltransferase